MGLEMKENNTELEDGEASCYYKGDDKNIDLDNDLSYIDERIQHVLGHFQKDFEGGVSSENLGAKFGGYGSFLPTYERFPSVWSHPKTPQTNYSTSRSPKSLTEGASQNLKASSNAPQPVRLGTAPYSSHMSYNSRVLPWDVSVKQVSCTPSTQVAERCSLRDETSNRSGNPTDQRTLKFRIKMNSDNTARKNVAIYSGLGLNSPSSSLGNSPEESGEMPPPSQVTLEESPTNIIQVMTSFPIPGDVLVSPLHESLLCLIRKKKLSQQNPVPSSKGHQEHSFLSVEESVSTRGNGKVLKDMKNKVSRKGERQLELKLENGINIKNDTRIPIKKEPETETLEVKEILSNGSKAKPLSNSVCDDGDCLKMIGRTSEASKEVNENEFKGRLSCSELVKEESLESISGQGCGRNDKQHSRCGLVENVWEHSVKNSHKDVPVDLRDEKGKRKGYKISASKDYSDVSKFISDVSKCKEQLDLHRKNAGKKGTFHEQEKTNVPAKREKLSFEGKIKSKGNLSNEKPPAVLTKESLGFEMGVVSKDKLIGNHGAPPSSRKMQKSKLQKDKVRDNHSFWGKNLEQRDRMDIAEKPADDIEVVWKESLDKPKEKLSGKKIDNRLLSRAPVKDAPDTCQPTMENGPTSEIVPAAASPVDEWVQCDSCQKWRLLPYGTKPEQLPEKWLCSMLNWLPGMNRCDISEEETTKACIALEWQASVNQQTHANGMALTSLNVQHPDQNYQNLSSHALFDRGKKEHDFNEIPNAGSGSGLLYSTKNHLQEPVKGRSLNDKSQPSVESNPVKRSSFQHMSKLQNLGMKKNIPKQQEKQMTGGNAKKVKLKNKEADQYTCGTSKKPKRGDMMHADKNQNPDIDLGRVGLSSSTGFLTQPHGQDFKYNELCYSGDTKDEAKDKLQVSAKILDNQTQVSLGGGSLGVRTCSKDDSSMKKRKMRDWQDNQNNMEIFQNLVHEGKVYTKEESNESGYCKGKKLRILKTDGKESSTGNDDDKSNRKVRVTHIVMSGTKVHAIDAMEKDKSIVKDQQPRKHSKKNVPQKTLDGVNSLRRDLVSGQVSLAATSSSSKVSGSHKIRGSFEEVKGSPVESVSSSPLRTSNSDKFTSTRGDAFGKGDPVCGDYPLTGNSRRCWDGDGNGNIDRFGTTRKDKISCSSHPESHKFSTVGYQDGDANREFSVICKPSPEVLNIHLLSSNDDSLEQHGQCPSNQHGMRTCHDEDREIKNHPEDATFLQKSGKGSCLQSKDKVRSSTCDSDRNKVKVSEPVNEYFKKSQRYASETDPNYHAFVPEKGNDVRHDLPKNYSTKSVKVKNEKYHVSQGDYAGQGSSDNGVETQVKRKDYDVSDVKLGATQSPNRKGAPQQNLIQESEGGQMQTESKSGKPKLLSHSQGERKEGTPSLCSRPVVGSEREVVFQGLPVDATVNGDAPKSLEQSGTVTNNKNGFNCSLGHRMRDQQGARDVSASSPVRSSSGQTATNTLEEAKKLRGYADVLKGSGFDFESSEAYFQAALKFLQGAVLLESCSSGNRKLGDMTQLQVYSTTAKLCEFCAHEYERREEVASAALAYKCMEVTYMRVVYFKHSSTNRDRHELQATLNMVHQGESPSSSASDVDNLNNQVTAEKAILSKVTGSHVAGNHVVVRNRSNFVRLLDFTQDVNFAMEASKKSQNAFAAACLTLEDAHKNDFISSIRRVIDFSFQDVEELIRLVQLAMEAISRSKIGGARD